MSSGVARLRIVAFNDVYELANLPRVQTFLTGLSPAPTAVVLAGDFLSPSTLSSIDNGRGMVATLRGMGLTHVSLGNHEQDLKLASLQDRLIDLSKSATVINSNVRKFSNFPLNLQQQSYEKNSLDLVTVPYSIIHSPCQRVKIALLGLLSDEHGLFRDDTFKKIPICNVLDKYSEYNDLLLPNRLADMCIPMTHQSLQRDQELAQHMLKSSMGGTGTVTDAKTGLIIGGHDHEPYDVSVDKNDGDGSIRILKSGMDAEAVNLIDLVFDLPTSDDEGEKPQLTEIQADLIEMSAYDPSIVVQKIVDTHMSVIQTLEDEIIINVDAVEDLDLGVSFSSERTRFQQTTVGGIFCRMIKDELEVDVALINGASIKGDMTYSDNSMTYAQLQKELPFPTKLVTIPMRRWEVSEAIHFSRNSVEEGSDTNAAGIPRRGFLQVDMEFEKMGAHSGSLDDTLQVALPRNLLNGFCKIQPLIDVGNRLKAEGLFPAGDDFVPAIEVIVRNACRHRWFQILKSGSMSFQALDLNNDGVIDRDEIKIMIETLTGQTPPDFVVDDMISSVDTDGNGVIDTDELNCVLARMERDQYWK